LFFGTGAPSQANTTSARRFYGLRDDTDMTNGATLTEDSAGIKDVSAASVTASRGWYVALPGRAERPVATANVFNSTVFFSTFTPDGAGACGPGGGSAKLYALQAWSGQAAIDFATGTAVAVPAASTPRFKEIGRGIASMPLVMTTPPVVPGTPRMSTVITATSNQELWSTAVPAPSFLKQVKSWRERIH
jgi:hypothetical protein